MTFPDPSIPFNPPIQSDTILQPGVTLQSGSIQISVGKNCKVPTGSQIEKTPEALIMALYKRHQEYFDTIYNQATERERADKVLLLNKKVSGIIVGKHDSIGAFSIKKQLKVVKKITIDLPPLEGVSMGSLIMPVTILKEEFGGMIFSINGIAVDPEKLPSPPFKIEDGMINGVRIQEFEAPVTVSQDISMKIEFA